MRIFGGLFLCLQGAKMKYKKPPLPFEKQLHLLKERGLKVADDKHALHVLEHINYYRLSGYFLPFQSTKDTFDDGTRLDDILYLYEFDGALRSLLTEGLARIEVSCKTQIAQYVALKYGAFGYIKDNNFDFKKPQVHISHVEWLNKIRQNVSRSHETFKKHFFNKYHSESDLPVWMAVELMSFGDVSHLYRGLRKQDRQDVARGYFQIDQRLMCSWLHTIVYIRNLCAHHSRIWNRQLAIRPLLNKKDANWRGVDNSKTFAVILLIKKMMHFQDKWDEWSGKLLILLSDFSRIDVSKMGFPSNWRDVLFNGKGVVY
jgi:abortive infection bacteriophage resistance protein